MITKKRKKKVETVTIPGIKFRVGQKWDIPGDFFGSRVCAIREKNGDYEIDIMMCTGTLKTFSFAYGNIQPKGWKLVDGPRTLEEEIDLVNSLAKGAAARAARLAQDAESYLTYLRKLLKHRTKQG